MKKENINNIFFILLLIGSWSGYYLLGYQTERSNFPQLISLYFFLFFAYYLLLKYWSNNILLLMGIGILFRASLLFYQPNLSDDFYRFFWDGTLFNNGINPFESLPSELMNSLKLLPNSLNSEIFNGLNSPDYYSVYPPICQYIFVLGTYLFPHSLTGAVVVMKSIILLCEIGSLGLIYYLLPKFNIHPSKVAVYGLNPLVINELTGNLHFEGVMIFFVLLSIAFLFHEKIIWSSIAMALAISTKFIPLLFLPFFIKRLGIKSSLFFFGVIAITVGSSFIPFINETVIQHLFSSIELYFQKFEFNASIYYLARWLGFKIYGYNTIANIGKIFSFIIFISTVLLAFFEQNISLKKLPQKLLIVLTIYFGLASIVHPWYICSLVMLSSFVNLRYALIWSFMIPLSYYSYTANVSTENIILIASEYLLVVGYLYYEIFIKKVSGIKQGW